MTSTTQIQDTISHLFSDAYKSDFGGDDPFDGLNAKIFQWLPSMQDSVVGLAWTQLFKRNPINFRRIAGIPKQRNPKGVALFITGMLLEHQRDPRPELLDIAQQLGDWLLTQTCDSKVWGAPCWGYHFPWKARAFYVPLGTPNLITTVYVSKALYELGTALNNPKYIEPALQSADFIVDKLFSPGKKGAYFCYIPGESALVHNANLWAAAWVRHSAELRGKDDHKTLALEATMTSIKAQKANGSWPYGARSHHQFVDGFHTGYNLETLQIINQYENSDVIKDSIQKGYAYYCQALFDEDGTARYYNTNPYPLDTHNFAQAVLTLIKIGTTQTDEALADRVVSACFSQLYLPEKNRFVYQKDSRITNKVNYIRWTQSWAYYALNFYLNHKKGLSK